MTSTMALKSSDSEVEDKIEQAGQPERIEQTDEISIFGVNPRHGLDFVGPSVPRSNRPEQVPLNTHQEEIIQLHIDGMSDLGIVRRLKDAYDIKVSSNTISKRLTKWGVRGEHITKGHKGHRAYKRILTPWIIEIFQWHQEGFDATAIQKRLEEEHSFITLATTIQNALDTSTPEDLGTPSSPQKASKVRENSKASDVSWRPISIVPPRNILPHEPRPADHLLDEELHALEEGVKAAYQSLKPPPHHQLMNGWLYSLTVAACFDETVQRTMVYETLQPGHHWSQNRLFDPLWVLGVQLPGSYSTSALDTHTKIMAAIDSITPQVLAEVYRVLKHIINRVISSTAKEHGEEYLREALAMTPATTTPKCIADLLHLTRMEITELQQDMGLIQSMAALHDLGGDIPALSKLSQFYATETSASSALEGFTTATLSGLESWHGNSMALSPLPPLTPSELAFIEDDTRDIGSESEDSEDDDVDILHETDKEVIPLLERIPPSRRLLQRVQGRIPRTILEVPRVYSDWRAPTTGPLLGFPPSRFSFASWTPDAAATANSMAQEEPHLTQGDERQLQRLFGELSAAQTPPSIPGNTLQESTNYLSQIISSQTAVEREKYSMVFHRMSSCVSRPPDLERKTDGFLWYHLEVTRLDDWWHCRRLLQVLATRCLFTEAEYLRFETQLIALLAAVETGSTEPVLFLVALDGLLRRISQRVSQSGSLLEQPETRLFDRMSQTLNAEILRELITFAHSVAQCNIVLRFPLRAGEYSIEEAKKIIAPSNQQSWYTLLHRQNPNCTRRDCRRLLLDPRDWPGYGRTGFFRVGIRDARKGSPHVRRFISKNRDSQIHDCISGWFMFREPHPALINAFFWYAELFHYEYCKAGRGKRAENF